MARIEVEINGARYIADSTAGPGRCADCAIPRRGKSCPWSLVCANVTEGAHFKRVNTGEAAGTGEERKAEKMAEMYKQNRYNGD